MTVRLKPIPRRRLAATAASATLVLLVLGHAQSCLAQQARPEAFPSAEAASHALYSAVQRHDEKAIMAVLGSGPELIRADDIEDKLLREHFVRKYRQMHRLRREPDGTTVLYIGAENWPFPVPLVSVDGAWHFDSAAGSMEVLFRRIGENEAMAIETSRALITAELQHSVRPRGAAPDGAIDALHANGRRGTNQVPYYGYYFRILTFQGPNSRSPAQRDVVSLVAYPAEYRSSGVMTFIVGADDVVYQKDLGQNTAEVASAMTAYRPDASWKPADQEP